MKKISLFLIAAAVAVWAFLPSGDNAVGDRRVELENASDSISFAVAMLVSQDMPYAMAEYGIDSTTIGAFVRGIQDAFPVDDSPEAKAYVHGLLVAASAMEMLPRADEAIYPGDTVNKVDRRMFLLGLAATAYGTGKTMTTKQAIEYYNHRVFRSVSEEFIRNNRERPGIVELPSGLQYKIEGMGTGKKATFNDTVECIYKVAYPNGVLVATSKGLPERLVVREQLPGLAEALMQLPAGTKCKLYLPWQLGYGAEAPERIAPYSALVYDLEIVGE